MIKRTCNARDAARMKTLARNGVSIAKIAKTVGVTLDCAKRNLKGVRVAKDISIEDVETEVIGEDEVEVTDNAAPAPPPAQTAKTLTPAQKAAATKKANKDKATAEAAGEDPDFLE